MKKLLIMGVAFAALTVAPALAADMPRKAPAYGPPPPPPVVYNWTGCYIGANIGGAWSRQTGNFEEAFVAFDQAPGSISLDDSSVIGGGHVGCNWQFAPQFVLGVEGDWSATKLDGSGTAANLFADGSPVGSGGITMSSDTKWLASLRARAGWVVVPQWMLYVTGGAAWTKTDYAAIDAFSDGCPPDNCGAVSFSNTKTGWTAGGGVEWMLTPNWILGAEYLYYQFGGASATGFFPSAPVVPAANFTWDNLQIHEVRARVSFKF
jgi:outer membrane immunogenic protein